MVGILMALEMSSTFLLSKLKPFLIARLGIDGLFLLFAGVLLLVILLTHTALPKQSLTKPPNQCQNSVQIILDNNCYKMSNIPI